MRKGQIVPTEWPLPEVIDDYLEWVREKGREQRTIDAYQTELALAAYWLEVHEETTLQKATTRQLRAWRRAQDCHARNTIIGKVTALKTFYKWAYNTQLVPIDPAWTVACPARKPSVPRPIHPPTVILAIEHAPPMYRLVLVLAAYAGLRQVEVIRMRREDIWTGPGANVTAHGKGGKDRTVLLSPFVLAELLEYGLPRRGHIFLRKDGRPFRGTDLDGRVNRWLHDLGIDETLHQARHSFGTAANSIEPDLNVLATQMGHSDPKVTMGYAAANEPKARAMVDGIQPNPWPKRLGDPHRHQMDG